MGPKYVGAQAISVRILTPPQVLRDINVLENYFKINQACLGAGVLKDWKYDGELAVGRCQRSCLEGS